MATTRSAPNLRRSPRADRARFSLRHFLASVLFGSVALSASAQVGAGYVNAFECADEWDEHTATLTPIIPRSKELSRARRGQSVFAYEVGDLEVFGFRPVELREGYYGPKVVGFTHAFLAAPKAQVVRRVLDRLGLAECDRIEKDGSCLIRAGKKGSGGLQTFVDLRILDAPEIEGTEIRCGSSPQDPMELTRPREVPAARR